MNSIKSRDLRIFCFIWSLIFAMVGIFFMVDFNNTYLLFFFLSVLFLFTGIFKPKILTSFYSMWISLGEVIGDIVSKIVMFILYFTIFTSVSLLLKILGKDLLNKKVNKSKRSYWIDRKEQPQSMKNQF